MLILIDDQQSEISLPPGEFSAAVKGILKHCADSGQVIDSITVDGKVYTDLEDSEFLSKDRDSIRKIEVRTQPIERAAVEILRVSAESIPRLIDEFARINQDLQSRNPEGGLQRIEQALSYWIAIVEGCLKSVSVLGTPFDAITVEVAGGEPIAGTRLLEKINALLEETQTAFENEDNLEIGDIFEYDLPPLLRSFQEVLYQLADRKN